MSLIYIKLILFTDDSNIFYSSDHCSDLIYNVNNELVKLNSWMIINKLSLNLDKTRDMFFGNCDGSLVPAMNRNGDYLDVVSEIKFLGITIDSKLNWKAHLRHIQNKVSKSISIINKAKYFLEHHALYLLYCSLVLPYLTYCIEIWATHNYKSVLHPVFILQKHAVRVIHKAGYYDHANAIFMQSKLLKLYDLAVFYTAQILFKASKRELPMNIQKLFVDREGQYSLRGCGNFKVPAVRTTRRSFCVSVCGVKL